MKTRDRVALLSIKSHFAGLILDGKKHVELRRRAPKLEPGDWVLVYASGQLRSIVGAFSVKRVRDAALATLWREFGTSSGIGRDQFDAYFAGVDRGVAIEIGSVCRFDEPISLADVRARLRGFVAPQSFRYLERDELNALRVEDSLKELCR